MNPIKTLEEAKEQAIEELNRTETHSAYWEYLYGMITAYSTAIGHLTVAESYGAITINE